MARCRSIIKKVSKVNSARLADLEDKIFHEAFLSMFIVDGGSTIWIIKSTGLIRLITQFHRESINLLNV